MPDDYNPMEMPQSKTSLEVAFVKSCKNISNTDDHILYKLKLQIKQIKVNYRLFLLDVYGVQYDDYEVNTLLPLVHKNCDSDFNAFVFASASECVSFLNIPFNQVDVSIYLILSWFDNRVNISSRQYSLLSSLQALKWTSK